MSIREIEELDRALRAEVEGLIKRATTLLLRGDAIVFLYGMVEDATVAMSGLEDEQWEAEQDVIYGLLEQPDGLRG